MENKKLSEEEIKEKIKDLDNWNYEESKISREFKFKDFREALSFTDSIGEAAEEKQHHPDITLKYGYVKIELSSHDVGGITEKDFSLAKEIDATYKEIRKNSEEGNNLT